MVAELRRKASPLRKEDSFDKIRPNLALVDTLWDLRHLVESQADKVMREEDLRSR